MKKNSDEYKKGDIVTFCLDENLMDFYSSRNYFIKSNFGKCYQKYSPFIKKIVALNGDIIEVKSHEIYLNGILIKNSFILEFDRNQKKINHLANGYKKILSKNELFLMGENISHSLDSRYFGLIEKNMIHNKAYLLWSF